MKPFLFLDAATAAFSIAATPARAINVTVDGITYDITTFTGSYQNSSTKFNTPASGGSMPWWGNVDLADDIAWEVQLALGSQDRSGYVTGPLFATSLLTRPDDIFIGTSY